MGTVSYESMSRNIQFIHMYENWSFKGNCIPSTGMIQLVIGSLTGPTSRPWSKIIFLFLLLSDVVGICASIQYALSLCKKRTGSIEGCRLNQRKSGVAFCERNCASSFLAV